MTILGFSRVVDAELVHGLDGGRAIGRGGRIGDGELVEPAARQHRARAVHQARRLRIEHQPADGVGEARAGHAQAVLLGLRPAVGVGGEEHLIGRAVGHLGVELARRAEAQGRGVAGGRLEGRGDLLGRLGEVGGHRDLGLGGQRPAAAARQDGGQRQADQVEGVA